MTEPVDPWSPKAGRVTRAYDDWHLADSELRVFLRLGLEFAEEGYRSRWERIQHRPGSESDDVLDLMDEAVGGVIPHQFEWLLANFCIRDGTTLYETYLEKALEEVCNFQIGRLPVADRSPAWGEFRRVFRGVFGVDPSPGDVDAVIDLRNLLTHRRGELRTDEDRDRYDTHEMDFPDLAVPLSRERVSGSLDALAASVERVDQVMYGHSWGRRALTDDQKARLLRAVAPRAPRAVNSP